MFLFVYGERNSGKSKYAENCACKLSQNRFYLATMRIMDEEGVKRVNRHRELRKGKGFNTIECPCDIDALNIRQDSVVLLECISNLVGNELFHETGRRSVNDAVNRVMEEILSLAGRVDNIVLVSSIYDSADVTMDDDSRDYLEALSLVNDRLKGLADKSVYIGDVKL